MSRPSFRPGSGPRLRPRPGPRLRPGRPTPAAALVAALALTTALTLSGCTADSSSDSASTASTPGPTVVTTETPPTPPEPTPSIPAYSIDELRRTVTDMGNACTTWTPATVAGGAGGWCQESMVGIFVFPDQASVEALVQTSADSSEPQPFLVGNRWVITSDNPASTGGELIALQDVIGGSLVGPDL